jgi:hypothetical protein
VRWVGLGQRQGYPTGGKRCGGEKHLRSIAGEEEKEEEEVEEVEVMAVAELVEVTVVEESYIGLTSSQQSRRTSKPHVIATSSSRRSHRALRCLGAEPPLPP